MSTKPSYKTKPCPADALVVLAILLLAAAISFLLLRPNQQTDGEVIAVVSIDGTEVDRFAPKELLQSPRTYTGNGYTLQVAYSIAKGEEEPGLCVAVSDCPTLDCVHTGTVTRSGQSIICLPARIIIELTGQPGDVDVVIG